MEQHHASSPPFSRPPIVTIMGHVDHGKTTLVDFLRRSNLAAKEAGAITQATAAYQVAIDTKSGSRTLTLIDTPGHAAFSAMRKRGGSLADVVILVVAADDGVKAQTKEAIHHAKTAGVPLVVALNKIDLPAADIKKVTEQLAQEGVITEAWGGDAVCVPISAKTGEGIPELFDMICLVADLQDITADPSASLEAIVVESHMDERKGGVVHAVIVSGTLSKGMKVFTSGGESKIKLILDDWGKPVNTATPGDPVALLGLKGLPAAGDRITEALQEERIVVDSVTTSEDVRTPFELYVKADSVGTLEAVLACLGTVSTEEHRIVVIGSGVGDINDSDVALASAAKCPIIGFSVRFPAAVAHSASMQGVAVYTYDIIYHLVEAVQDMVDKEASKTEYTGKGLAVVLQLFPLSSGDTVLGSLVVHGSVRENDKVTVSRDDVEVYRGSIKQLRAGMQRMTKVSSGKECGIFLKPHFLFKVDDVIEVL